MLFGVPMMMLNLNRITDEEDNSVVESVFGFWLPNMIVNQYLLALGEFNMDNFGAGSQMSLCWIFFILATFFSLILMLNMLIAIMGDTFERVMENREINAVKTKL